MSSIAILESYVNDIAGTDTTSFPSTDKKRAMTRWAHALTEEVIDAMSDFDFQGEISTSNLVADQREYLFPADMLKIKRIDLRLDGKNWVTTAFMDESEPSHSISSETDIVRRFNNTNPFVSLLDESFFIFSGTISDVTAGIKIWYDKEVVGKKSDGTDLTSFTADTDTPNLKEFAQMGLVCGSVLDFADKNGISSLAQRMNLRLYGNAGGRPADSASVGGIVGRLRTLYSNRAPDQKTIIKTASSLENYS